jgi:predicted O-linked N-acetylglucosamine transferase (SPINDLY family)
MIADTPEAYEETALALAREPSRLAAIKAKLARNRRACPLFDTRLFTRHLEAAYARLWERAERGLKPESFTLEPEPSGLGS